MDKITKMWACKLPMNSQFVKPSRLYYVQDGVEKSWDLIKANDSVSIILYNKCSQKLVFVKQFRPPVYFRKISNYGDINKIDLKKLPVNFGITLELCGGMVDKGKCIDEIAKEEILEECGYDVGNKKLENVLEFRCDVGVSGAKQKMFFCEVTDEEKVGNGGGIHDEKIEVVDYKISEISALIQKNTFINSPSNLIFGVLWFLNNKCLNNVYKFH